MAGALTLAGTSWLVLRWEASGRHLLQQKQETHSHRVRQTSQGFCKELLSLAFRQKLHRRAGEVTPPTKLLCEYDAKSRYLQAGFGAMPLLQRGSSVHAL